MSVQAFFKKFLALSALLAAFAIIPLHAQTVAYVTNETDNTVSVINTATNAVTATIPVGSTPLAVVFSPDGSRAYVTNSGDGTVSAIDTASNTVAATISLVTLSTPSPFPMFPAITPDGKSLYVPDLNDNAILIIDTATNTVRSAILPPGANAPVSVAISPDGLLAYTLNAVDGTVIVLDTATNTQQGDPIATNAVPGQALKIVMAADGRAYVPGGFTNEVAVISGTTVTAVPFPDGAFILGVAISPDSTRVYTAVNVFGDPGVLSVDSFDANNPPPAGSLTAASPTLTGAFLLDVALTPDGASTYVTVPGSNTVLVIDNSTHALSATIGVGNVPIDIAIAHLTPPPTAVAGPNQTITVDQTVHLDGSGSFAPNTLPAGLQYAWSFVSQPTGSTALLNNANTATPNFVADAVGTFVAQLVVTDPATNKASKPSQVTISSIWSPPTANAGGAQSVLTGALVHLSGLGSTDPNHLPLTTYAWSFTAKPVGSAATITPGTLGLASFTADVKGLYTVQLVVSDAFGSSQPSTVDITAIMPETSQELLQDVITAISGMSASSFDAAGHSQSLTNQLSQAITDIQKEKISQAIDKINNAIIRTDGFPVRGALDGPGPGMDWIIDANDQKFAYDKLTDALKALQ